MNDEIKEIFEEHLDSIVGYPFQKKDKEYILDYITNLQQENERLKEENKHIFANVNDDELLISNAMNYAEAQDYKSRVEKAVEYIKNDMPYLQEADKEYEDMNGDTYFTYKEWDDTVLLNILQNGSDSQ